MNPITAKLLTKKPGLQNTLELHGLSTLADYSSMLATKANMSLELLHEIKNVAATYEITAGNTVTKRSLLHTADHHGILNHPFFWCSKITSNSNIPTVVLATSNISPSNSSYPRGLYWYDAKLEQKRAPLLPLSYRRFALYGVKALSKETFSKWIDNFDTAPGLKNILIKVCADERLYNTSWLSEQLMYINDSWWKEIFGSSNLVYLELESVVNSLLLKSIKDSNDSIFKILFDTTIRQAYLDSFNGITGAHSENKLSGSQLFWFLDHKKLTRHSLWLRDGALLDEEGNRIELTPSEISKHLEDRTLLPTLALSYSILAFENNATLTGGFSQIDYLGDMALAWNKVFHVSTTPQTNLFSGEMSLYEISNVTKSSPATLCDLIMQYPSVIDRLNFVSQKLNERTLNEAIDAIAPDLLKIIENNL